LSTRHPTCQHNVSVYPRSRSFDTHVTASTSPNSPCTCLVSRWKSDHVCKLRNGMSRLVPRPRMVPPSSSLRSHTPDCLGFSLKFSDCGRMLHALAIVAPAKMADACKGGILAGVVLTSYTLSADLSCKEGSPVSQSTVSHYLTRLDMDSWATTFSVTWMQDHAYVCLGQREMRVLRFDLAQLVKSELGVCIPEQFPFLQFRISFRRLLSRGPSTSYQG
jgi:hypothetical protein